MFRLLFFTVALLIAVIAVPPYVTHADTVADIKEQIESINAQRAALNAEIAEYQRQLNEVSSQKQTLQGTIQVLDVSRSKTATQIKEIQAKIKGATLKLDELSFEITDKEQSMALDKAAVAASIRSIYAQDTVPLIEQVISSDGLADAWITIDGLGMLNRALQEHTAALKEAKVVLAEQHQAVSATKNELSSASVDLQTQKKVLDINRQEKEKVLAQTKAKESEYQALLAAKQQQRAQFEKELSNLEDSLRIAIDPSRIPAAGGGIFSYPVTGYTVSQGYGLTSFAKSGAYGYDNAGNPKPHLGIDFAVPVGTPVYAPLSGTVRGWGNTDAISGCYSFGKWILIDHGNGLSTAYLHLSGIAVSKGDTVTKGQVIGYSGNTGYSTGAHLHFAVYATQGVEMMNLGTWYAQSGQSAGTACARGGAIIPVAPKDAYLNPMSYL